MKPDYVYDPHAVADPVPPTARDVGNKRLNNADLNEIRRAAGWPPVVAATTLLPQTVIDQMGDPDTMAEMGLLALDGLALALESAPRGGSIPAEPVAAAIHVLRCWLAMAQHQRKH